MGLIDRLFRPAATPPASDPLYTAIVALARAPHWYVEGAVADSVDGRFDMVAAVLSLVLIRLERDPAAAAPSVELTERFVTDMDGQLREIGIGDIVVGKHIGRMMAALGGRLGAYRDGLAEGDLAPAVMRNVYRGSAPDADALAHVAARLRDLHDRLDATPTADVLAGRIA